MTNEERTADFFVGLDLGQSSDPSALCIIQRDGAAPAEWRFTVRYLKRWPLGTPYQAIVEDTVVLCAREPLTRWAHVPQIRPGAPPRVVRQMVARPTLVVDKTGVGAAPVDLFRAHAGLTAKLAPVMISGGDRETREGDVYSVPKRNLVAAAQIELQNGRLKIVPTLAESQTLRGELEGFKVKIKLLTGHDSYGEWRQGKHDDLVLATALALHFARRAPATGFGPARGIEDALAGALR